MIKADKYYIQNLLDIKENGLMDENPRPKYKDGTPAHCKYITQVFEKYDISKGEFPITTLRNTAVKTGIKELLVIYQKQVNTQKGFEENGVFWWNEWMNDEGNIGRAYSHNLESHRTNEVIRNVVKVKRKIIDKNFSEKTDDKKRKYFNIGFLGNYKTVSNFSEKHIKILMDMWENCLRCCNSQNNQFKENYTNCFVHQDWHSFENFLRDIRLIPQYFLAVEDDFIGWDLDKDYYSSNCYSKETCVFLKKRDKILYSRKPFEVTYPNDTKKIFFDQKIFSVMEGLTLSKVNSVLNGQLTHHKKYKFKYIDENDDFVYRYELSRNEVVCVLEGLKNDPFGRRHIISLWNWANIDKKMLVECAYETLFTVRKVNDTMFLDMTLVQRK